MKLEFIPLGNLTVSKANMRYARKAPDVSDILPTIRARGVLQPILVRPCGEPPDSDGNGGHAAQRYEIVAGARRFHAASIVAAEQQQDGRTGKGSGTDIAGGTDAECPMLPCAVLDDTDDAGAVEASLIENIARLDPDEVSRWACFTRLVKEGRSVAEIAATFGLPELSVRRALALGNLLPRIREMYRREEIDAVTIRHLALASRRQQQEWLALVDNPDAWAPRGHQLKSFFFGGSAISARHALFEVEASGLALVCDLFGEDAYFADPQAFWTLQNAAIEGRRSAFLASGWSDAVILPPDEHFHSWEHEKTPKRKGGRVYLDVRGNGEVAIHEGYLSRKEAERMAKAERAASGEEGSISLKPARAELTALTQTYVDLHRHAALRAELQGRPGTALRLMVAHAIAGSALWRVTAEPQAVKSDAVRASLAGSRAEAVFGARRRTVLALLGLPEDEPSVTGSAGYGMAGTRRNLCALLARLVDLSDSDVLEVLALGMGETLAAGSAEVEAVGTLLGLGMDDWWQADEAFLDTLRDREVLLAMVGEVAGPLIAAANAKEKGKVLKAILRAHLAGEGAREKKEGWVPRWMAFPPSAYTARGVIGTVQAHARAVAALEPDPVPDLGFSGWDEEAAAMMEDDGCDGARCLEPEPEGADHASAKTRDHDEGQAGDDHLAA